MMLGHGQHRRVNDESSDQPKSGHLPVTYADHTATNEMTLRAEEFLRRFRLHVLPRGFVRIRHYGIVANRHREQKLRRCRELLGVPTLLPSPEPLTTPDPVLRT